MSPLAATALRRAAIMGGGLGATLVGHMLTTGEMRVLPIAPFLWLGLLSLMVLSTATSRRVDSFRAWRPARVLLAAVATQALFHVTFDSAPWAFGLVSTAHHAAPLITPGALVVHVAVALILWAALCFGQGLLVAAVAAARALLAPSPRRGRARPHQPVAWDDPAAPVRWRHAPRTSRGPPPWVAHATAAVRI